MTKRIKNIYRSDKTENDWTLRKAALRKEFRTLRKIPEAVDLRENWWKPGNQGSTGSCVGWSLGDGVLRWHFVKKRKLQHNEKLSVRYIWMASKEIDELHEWPSTFIDDAGTTLKTALDVARKFGCIKEADLPFNGDMSMIAEDRFYKLAGKMKIKSYYNLMRSGKDSLAAIRKWIGSGKGPVFLCVNADKTWDNAKKTEGHLHKFIKPKEEYGHAVCIVGYTPDYFIIRNSWGTSDWGDNGFAYASNAYAKEAFLEAYGVVV